MATGLYPSLSKDALPVINVTELQGTRQAQFEKWDHAFNSQRDTVAKALALQFAKKVLTDLQTQLTNPFGVFPTSQNKKWFYFSLDITDPTTALQIKALLKDENCLFAEWCDQFEPKKKPEENAPEIPVLAKIQEFSPEIDRKFFREKAHLLRDSVRPKMQAIFGQYLSDYKEECKGLCLGVDVSAATPQSSLSLASSSTDHKDSKTMIKVQAYISQEGLPAFVQEQDKIKEQKHVTHSSRSKPWVYGLITIFAIIFFRKRLFGFF